MRLGLLLVFVLVACGDDDAPADSGVDSRIAVDTGGDAPRLDSAVDSGPATGLAAIRLTDGVATWRPDGMPDEADAPLTSIAGHNAFWFAWSVFNGGTDLYGGASIQPDVIAGDGECGVPCDEIVAGCPGRDCIPPLDSPTMVSADDSALSYLADGDMIMGVVTSEGPRAYPHNILWWHEIINEDVGGEAFTISFCPLTGSGLRFDRRGFIEGTTVRLGVSGLLYNSNLVMWDRETENLWSQMLLESVSGDAMGAPSPVQPVFEMTWGAWQSLHPDTLVVSSETGHSRDYTSYPYTRGGDYRTNHADTFRATNPSPDPQFQNKDMVFGITRGTERRGYVWSTLRDEAGGPRGVVNDTLGGTDIAVVFDLDAQYVHAFDRSGTAGELALVE